MAGTIVRPPLDLDSRTRPADPAPPISGLEVMTRLHWREQRGQRFLVLDLKRSSPDDSLALLEAFVQSLGSLPLIDDPLRLLIDVAEAAYEPAVTNRWKAAWLKHENLIQAIAVTGDGGLVQAGLLSFADLAHFLGLPQAARKIRHFDSREAALASLLPLKTGKPALSH